MKKKYIVCEKAKEREERKKEDRVLMQKVENNEN